MGVVDENMGVVDENLGVVDENLEVVDENILGSPIEIWGSSMKIWGSSIERQLGSSMKWGRRWVVDNDDFFPDSLRKAIRQRIQQGCPFLHVLN